MKLTKTREKLIEMYIKSLEENILPWEKTWEGSRRAYSNANVASNNMYTGINQMLLEEVAHARNYISSDWLTLNQLKKLHEKEEKEAAKIMEKNTELVSKDKSLLEQLTKDIKAAYNQIKQGNPNQYLQAYNKVIIDFKEQHEGYDNLLELKDYEYVLENAKGQGVPIEFWSYYDKSTKKTVTSEEVNKIMNGADEERKKQISYVCKIYYVYNASLVPKFKNKIEKEVDRNHKKRIVHEKIAYIENANKVLDIYAKNENVSINEIKGASAAWYSPSSDEISIPSRIQFSSLEAFIATKAHELVHSTNHEKRLNRPHAGYFDNPEVYAKEELVAEIGSSFLCADLGIKMSEFQKNNHKSYIQHWIRYIKEKPESLFKAINQGIVATEFIKEKGEYKRILEEQKKRETILFQGHSQSQTR